MVRYDGVMDQNLTRRQGERLAALSEISKLVVGTTDADRATLEVFNALRDRFKILGGLLGLRNQESGKVEVVAASGFPSKLRRDAHFRWASTLLEDVVRTGYAQVIANVREESTEKTALSNEDQTWAVCVPIRVRGRTSGALWIEQGYTDKAGPFEEAVNFLRIVAAIVGQAYELQLRFGRTQQSSRSGDAEEFSGSRLIIGTSPVIREVLQAIDQVGPGGATVLIRGESGTGKELVAKALHQVSPRKGGPFVKVVCAALPETLLETALFGHERGAFTGATERKHGFLEEASGGTLFLDEIGEISPSTQIKLLRFLQERTFERVGGTKPISVDVRIITATNRDLELEVSRGQFREDLYYRLNVVPITLPPLRERAEDIPLLIEHFVNELSQHYKKEIVFAGDAVRKMQEYDWPGNVRELENFIERLMVLAPDRLITAKDIVLPRTQTRLQPTSIQKPVSTELPSTRPTLHEIEREQVVKALELAGGVQTVAARQLGISPRQLAYRVKKYQIARKTVKYS